MSSTQPTRRALLARERSLNRALDKPWTYDGDESDEELHEELLNVERQLAQTPQPIGVSR
jgi:hypothetical protein